MATTEQNFMLSNQDKCENNWNVFFCFFYKNQVVKFLFF